MIQIAKIVLLLIISVFSCSVVGKSFCDALDIDVRFHPFSYGFIFLLSVFELLTFIPLVTYQSSAYVYLSLCVLIAIVVASAVKNRKELLKLFFNKSFYVILLFAALTFITFFLFGYCANNYNDQYYYLSLIRKGMDSGILNHINLLNSGWMDVDISHSFNGIYTLYSLLARVFRIKPYLLCIWYTGILFAFFVYSANFELAEAFKFKGIYKILFYIFLICENIFLFIYIDLTSCGNLYTAVFLAFIIVILLKEQCSLKDSITVFLFSWGVFALQGSNAFVMIEIIFAYYCMVVFNNESPEQYRRFFIAAYPTLVVSLIVFYKTSFSGLTPFISIIIYAGVALALLVTDRLFALAKYRRSIVIAPIAAVVIVVYAMSFVLTQKGNPLFVSNQFFDVVTFNFRAIMFASVSALYFVWKTVSKSNNNYPVYLIAAVVFVFFNPFVLPFVSTYITSVVYNRIGELVYGMPYLFFYEIWNIQPSKIISIAAALATVIAGLAGSFKTFDSIPKTDIEPLYRVETAAYDALNEITRITDDFYNENGFEPRVFSSDFRISYFADKYINVYNIYSWRGDYFADDGMELSNQSNEYSHLYNALAKSLYYEDPSDACEYATGIIYNKNVSFILVDKSQAASIYQRLDAEYTLIYENDGYRIYNCR